MACGVDRIRAPHPQPRCPHPNPQGKRNFAGVIKSRILRYRDYSGCSLCALCNHKGPYKGDTERPESQRQRFKDATQLAVKMEEEAMSQEM